MSSSTKLGSATSSIAGVWSTASNVLSDADSNAVATTVVAAKNTTNILELQTFGFDALIPADARIVAVSIAVSWKVSSNAGIANLDIYWRVSSTNGTTHSNTAEPTSLTTDTYNVSAERAFTRADMLDGTFTVRIQGRSGNDATSITYSYDWVTVTGTYLQDDDKLRTVRGVGRGVRRGTH